MADAIVVGLGAMGSAALAQLARAGATAIGFDRFDPPHPLGSSHGDSRLTRLAIAEGSDYVPLVVRSNQLWRELEVSSGEQLLIECGGLTMSVQSERGRRHGVDDFLGRVRAVAEERGIDHENLEAAEIAERFPQFDPVGSEDGYYEPGAGYLRPEACVRAQLQLAARHGAEQHRNEPVTSYEADGDSVVVTTRSGTYEAGYVILAAGPWIGDLVPEYRSAFRVCRQVLYWFAFKDAEAYESHRRMPVFIWETGGGPSDFMYGFPATGGPEDGAKLATEQYSSATDPDRMDREIRPAEIEDFYERFVRDRLPGLDRRCVKATACPYTVTRDSRFVIDRHPDHRNVFLVSACSGHGFKHSAAIGEALAQLVTTGHSDLDLTGFSLARLGR